MSSTTPLRTDVRAIEGDDVRALDRHFGDALVRWARPAADADSAALLRRLGTLLSAELGRQNVCLELATLAETAGGDWPSPGRILELLEGHGLLRSGDAPAPLVAEAGRLYLARYHDYEVQVARALHARAGRTVDAGRDDPAATAARLAGLFPDEPGVDVNWQRVGAAIALDRALAVITGGPGTGKTTTVTRLLVMLLEQAGGAPVRIRLAAPTGKAAARLTESIRDSRTRLLDAGLCTRRSPTRCRMPPRPCIACSATGRWRTASATAPTGAWPPTWWWWTRPRWWICG
ncbi:MAG: AAA family ATPase [Gammaproteobacteria bacterium]|nr:AAA family ATPase [Gammaproteobacteria bacterium]